MFLYEKEEKKLKIYTFNCNQELALQYRENEMKKISEEKRVLIAEFRGADCNYLGNRPFYMEFSDSAIVPAFAYVCGGNPIIYHNFIPENNEINRQILLEKYYFGHFIDRRVFRMSWSCKMNYFLLTETTYCESDNNRYKILKGVIQLPESLYVLQLLEQEKFSLLGSLSITSLFDGLKNCDISEQLKLFNITYISDISLDELQKMDACGITKNMYEQTLAKAENDAHVLKLIKK